jgi:hypothetical protein
MRKKVITGTGHVQRIVNHGEQIEDAHPRLQSMTTMSVARSGVTTVRRVMTTVTEIMRIAVAMRRRAAVTVHAVRRQTRSTAAAAATKISIALLVHTVIAVGNTAAAIALDHL